MTPCLCVCYSLFESPSPSPTTSGQPWSCHLPQATNARGLGLLPAGWEGWQVNSFHLWLQLLRCQLCGLSPKMQLKPPPSRPLITLVQLPAPVNSRIRVSIGSWQPAQGSQACWLSPTPSLLGGPGQESFCLKNPPRPYSRLPPVWVWVSLHWVYLDSPSSPRGSRPLIAMQRWGGDKTGVGVGLSKNLRVKEELGLLLPFAPFKPFFLQPPPSRSLRTLETALSGASVHRFCEHT